MLFTLLTVLFFPILSLHQALTFTPQLLFALPVATYVVRFDEVLAGAGSFGPEVRIRSTSDAGAGHWLKATPILPSLRFPAPLFVTTFNLRLGLPQPYLATYMVCSRGHPLDPLGTHLSRCARASELTSSYDSVHDAGYHIIHEFFGVFLVFFVSFGRVEMVISDVAVGHTLVDIVVADPTRHDLVERAARDA